jgi:hypothetical protein
VKFLDAEHVTMVGNGHAAHTVGYSLVNQPFNARLTVQNRVICMYVKMYKVFHKMRIFDLEVQSYAEKRRKTKDYRKKFLIHHS